MKNEEIALIRSKHNAAIIAPAGHGKTEMITDLVDKLPGKKLVLTHTNAGVSALSQRLARKNVSHEKYGLFTISSFCLKWCSAYPSTAGVNPTDTIMDKEYYPKIHNGATSIFANEWARYIIKKSYSCVIVDEYQDCVLAQHQIFIEINKSVPVYVLGDPLQAIFGFSEPLVSWKNLIFDIIDNDKIEIYPWRWEKSNPRLGIYLKKIRKILLQGLDGIEVSLSTVSNGASVHKINTASLFGSQLSSILSQYDTILYIAKWPKDSIAFAKKSGGIFQNDEKQDIQELYKYTNKLDVHMDRDRAKILFEFIEVCSTNSSTELHAYKKHIETENYDFHLIKKYPGFGENFMRVYHTYSHNDMLSMLEWTKENTSIHMHRRELFSEMQRAIRRSRDLNIPITLAAKQIRMIPENQSKYTNYRRLASTTLLSKGLEFDCVIIDLTKANFKNNRYSVTEMYVAMTRAKKAIFFLTDENEVLLSPPAGI